MQSQQEVHADDKAGGVKAAKGKRAASAHQDDLQVHGLLCMTEQLEVAFPARYAMPCLDGRRPGKEHIVSIFAENQCA